MNEDDILKWISTESAEFFRLMQEKVTEDEKCKADYIEECFKNDA